MEVAQQRADGAAARDHVDPQRAARGPDGGDGARLDLQELAGVRQERAPFAGQLGAARRAGEERARRAPRSSAATRLETACWVSDSCAAARWNWPASATATKVLTASRSTTNGCSDGCLPTRRAAALMLPLGTTIRLALGRVRGQHVRHVVRAGRLRADRDPGARRRPGGGLGARRGGAGGRCDGGRTARPVGGAPTQAARDGRDGPASASRRS